MPVKQELIDLYHEYLAVTNHQAAAACLVILDVLGQGPEQVHLLVTGDKDNEANTTGAGFMALEDYHQQPSGPDPAPVVAPPVVEAERQPDEWAKLLDAYRELKKRG